ncbi:receptor-like protein EIX2 [Humulus lupulus]|uniref:receptor-like protein EIX2 n=1 Tax=Humulus lupulus TaxID=3486 RepID=UPI002B40665B|nr:receptor-like protein EIX2 [Humulus lupulus]
MMVFNEGKGNSLTRCIEKERQALLRFKESLEDNANILSSWKSSDEDCCAWKRIRCDNHSNHVIMLDLGSNKSSFIASHEINSALIELHHLKYLDLSYNKFSTTIPKFIGSLKRLQYLNLSGNPLSGTIPSQIQYLTKLKTLDLDNNRLVGPFPNNLSQFLLILRLNNNNLTGPLPDLSHLSSLREFNIANNRLNNTLPESIGKLHNLRVLDVSSNSFTGVFSEIHVENLINLKQLALSFNSLLEFKFNTNWVPQFQLNAIELSSCKLGPQFPSWLQTQLNLSIIDLSNSRISDTIPPWFCNLTSNLKHLNLSFNQITGSLPNFSLSSHNDFPIVDLSSNKFYGAILQFLSKAYMLDLSSNNLSSFGLFLCSEMIGEPQIEILDLSNNFLSGRLLYCWWRFKNLHVLNLESNKLFGTIPSSIGYLHKILTLSLRHNNLSGVLPTSLNNCTNLKFLDVGENNLEGKVPTWIGERLTNLMVLDLNANSFNGSIPSNLCNLHYIQILDLSENNIHGSIPPCMDNFTSMVHSSNMDDDKTKPEGFLGSDSHNLELYKLAIVWKGVKHVCGKSIVFMRLIDLSSNRLEGEIPKRLTNLLELIQFNLSRNHLSGSLPENIGQLQKLESLDLSHNQFSGKVPQSLANMSFLGYLNLSNNQLNGKIPSSTQLQSFDTSSYLGNQGLCGQPLKITCPENETPSDSSAHESDNECNEEWLDMSWFYMGIFVGFTIGFCGVCGNLLQSTTSGRLACSQFLHNFGVWFYVRIISVEAAILLMMRKFSI